MLDKEQKRSIMILSYKYSKHPRANKIAKILKERGYKVIIWESKESAKIKKLNKILIYLYSMFDILRIKADIYWIENVPDIVYLPIALFKKLYVYDRRSPWSLEVVMEYKNLNVFRKLLELIERYLIKNACHVVVVSNPMKKEYEDIYKKKGVTVLPNYPEEGFKCSGERKLRAELGISDDTKIFLYIGRLSLVEGVDLLAKIGVALKDTNSELWIVGDGPGRGIIERLASRYSHIRWFGWVNRKDIPLYLDSADYGLVPRRKSPSSIFYSHEGVFKIGEYVRCGLKVIASGIAPSPYYLLVDENELPKVVREVAQGKLEVPDPPPIKTWEEVAETVVRIIDKCKARGSP